MVDAVVLDLGVLSFLFIQLLNSESRVDDWDSIQRTACSIRVVLHLLEVYGVLCDEPGMFDPISYQCDLVAVDTCINRLFVQHEEPRVLSFYTAICPFVARTLNPKLIEW